MIIWGTRKVVRGLGYVSDFCPICRSIRPFRVESINMAGHIYFIPIGRGQIVGFKAACQECDFIIGVDAMKYKTVSKKTQPDMASLINETFPNIDKVYHDRLRIEEKVIKFGSELSVEEREALVIEPLNAIAPMMEEMAGGKFYVDKIAKIIFTFSVSVPIFLFIICCFGKNRNIQDKILLPAVGISFIVGLIVSVIFLLTSNLRYLRNIILPMLAKSLKPLKPTEEELQNALEKLRNAGFYAGRKLNAKDIVKAISFQVKVP